MNLSKSIFDEIEYTMNFRERACKDVGSNMHIYLILSNKLWTPILQQITIQVSGELKRNLLKLK